VVIGMSRELKRVLVINDASSVSLLVGQSQRRLAVYATDDMPALHELLADESLRIDLVLLDATGKEDAKSLLAVVKSHEKTRLVPVAVFVECNAEINPFYDLHANSVIEKTSAEEFGGVVKTVLDFWLSPHICTPTRLDG
jgi:hypothetical protein